MNKRKVVGIVFVALAMIISLVNILDVKITGAFFGVSVKSSIITIVTLVLFLTGLLFLSKLEKGLITGAIVVGVAGGANYKIQSDKEKQYFEDIKITAPYWSDLGRFQRTYRWDDILDDVEKENKIPKGLLKGLAMRESYGDPLRLNKKKDGGAGLYMFSPGTGDAYGLKVSGNAKNTGVDKKNGEKLKKLIAINKNDYEKMGKIDERFNLKKSAEAAAQYLKHEYNKYHSWDKALSAYNQGTPAPNAKDTKHVKAVREYQDYYNKHDKMDRNSIFWKLAGKGHPNKSTKGHR